MHSLDILELNSPLCLYLSHQDSLSNHVCLVQLAHLLPLPSHLPQPLLSHLAVLTYGFAALSLREEGLVEDFLEFLHPFHALPQERLIGCRQLRILLGDVVALGEGHARQVVGEGGSHGMMCSHAVFLTRGTIAC